MYGQSLFALTRILLTEVETIGNIVGPDSVEIISPVGIT